MIIPYPKKHATYSLAWYMVSLLLHVCMLVGAVVIAVWWPVHEESSHKKPQAMHVTLVRMPKQPQNTQSKQTLHTQSLSSPVDKASMVLTKPATNRDRVQNAEAKQHTVQAKPSVDALEHASTLHTKHAHTLQSMAWKKQASGAKADAAHVASTTARSVAKGKAIDSKAQHAQEKKRALPLSHVSDHAQQVQQGQQMVTQHMKAQQVLSWKEVDGEQKKSLIKKHAEAKKQRLEAERVQREVEEKQRLEAKRVQREVEEKQRLEAERVQREVEEKQRLEAERLQREEEKKRRLEAKRLQREEEKKRRLEAELIRQEEEERMRQEALARTQAEKEEKKRREIIRRQQLAEEKKRKQQAYDLAKQQAIEEMQMHIAEFATLNDKDMLGLSAKLKVHLDQEGHVIKVTVQKSSGNTRFDEIAVNTWFKASPIPLPDDPDFPELRKESQDINFDFHLTELSG